MKKDAVPTNVTLPAPDAPRVKPPNYMVFVCSLDRADKAARKDPARLARFQELRAAAIAAYKAKDYAGAVRLHDEAHAAAAGQSASVAAPAVAEPVAEVAEVTAARSPRLPKDKGGKKQPAAKAPAKPAPPKPAKEKASKPAKPAKGAPKLSAMSAAAQVLAASKEPLNVKQIIAAMSGQGLWTSPGGKTPHATLAAALQRDIAAKGRESRFRKADRGLFTASGR